MKKLAASLMLIILCVTLFGCDQSLAPQKLVSHEDVSFRVYVSGAVEKEGYFTVSAGTAVSAVIESAGVIEQTVFPSFAAKIIDGDTAIFVDYYEKGGSRTPINVNSIFIRSRLDVEGLSADVVDKLASYIERYGVISNRTELATALGEDYAENYYKLYVDEKDYEAAN